MENQNDHNIPGVPAIDQFIEEADLKLQEKRQFLKEDDLAPTMPFYVEFNDGRRGEAKTPLALMDLIIDPNYSDIDDPETAAMVTLNFARDLAASFALELRRAVVYDALGPFFDTGIPRFEDEVNEEVIFEEGEPVIIDAFDNWTLVKSMVDNGIIRLYEKIPVWIGKGRSQGCDGCTFRSATAQNTEYCGVWETEGFRHWDNACPYSTSGAPLLRYTEVTPENVASPGYKPGWRPLSERTQEYFGLRLNRDNDDE